MFHIAGRIGRTGSILLLVLVAGVVLLLAFASIAYAQTPPGWLAPSTEKPVYLIGEPVGLILTNVGTGPITWQNPAAIINDCFIYDAWLQLVFDGSKIFVPFYWDPVTIYPGQSAATSYSLSLHSPGAYFFGTADPPPQLAGFTVAVPEPSSFLALLCGIGGLGGVVLRRRSA